MLAIIGVFLLINRQTAGFLEAMIMYILPLPIAFYGMKYGARDTVTVVVAGLILAAILSTPSSLAYTAAAFLIGLIYGNGIYKKKPMRRTLLLAMAVGALTEVLIMCVFAGVFGYDINAEISAMKDMFSQVEEQSGTSFSTVFDMDQLIMELIVISCVLTGVIEVLVTHLLARLMMTRMHIHVVKDTPISEYYPPKWTGYAGLAGFVAFYYSVQRPLANDTLQMTFQALGIVAMIYLWIWGIIAMSVLCRHLFHMSRGGAIVVCLLSMMLTQFLCVLGFVYIVTRMHERMMEGSASHAQ